MHRRILAILLSLALLMGAQAFAFKGSNYTPWDGTAAPSAGLNADFNGEKLSLHFDATSEYSNCADGILQACFFAFDGSQQNYLEFYLLLPQNVAAGDILRCGENSLASATMYEVSQYNEVMYYAGEMGSAPWPNGSSLEIHIETASIVGSAMHVSGSMNGLLYRLVNTQPTNETVSINEAHFDFTLPLNGAAVANDGAIIPAFTLPPDYRVL